MKSFYNIHHSCNTFVVVSCVTQSHASVNYWNFVSGSGQTSNVDELSFNSTKKTSVALL